MRGIYLVSARLLLMQPLLCCSPAAQSAELHDQTVKAWQHYVALTEARIDLELNDGNRFLLTEFLPKKDGGKCREKVAKGGVCIQSLESREKSGRKVPIPKGTVSHWLGSVRIPDADLDTLIAFVQSYDIHEQYFADVEKSKLVNRDGNNYRFFYRLKQSTGPITVYYNTVHEVNYRRHGKQRVTSASRTKSIHELDKPGKDEEREKPEGKDSGYMWRLNSYWRFQQDKDGVELTLESLTLSRGIPGPPVSWVVSPIVEKISKGLLETTLLTLRNGYHAYLDKTHKAVMDSSKASYITN